MGKKLNAKLFNKTKKVGTCLYENVAIKIAFCKALFDANIQYCSSKIF